MLWWGQNNLELNTLKTWAITALNTAPLTITNRPVFFMETFKFLGTTIFQNLKQETINSIINPQQGMYFPRQLRKCSLTQELVIHFYTAVIESILYTSLVRQLILHSAWLVLYKNQELGRKNHHRFLTPLTQPFPTPAFWQVLQNSI